MSRYRFLFQRRWLLLALGAAAFVVICSELSTWQFHRLDQRRAENHVITANIDADPEPAGRLLAPGRPLDPDREWHPVTARGRYDTGDQVLVRYRYLDGEPGFHVLTPLVTDQGPILLVDRGWVPKAGNPARLPPVPASPRGVVTVTGRARQSEQGPADQVRPRTGEIRYIDVPRLAGSLPRPVYGGYVELTGQDPTARDSPHLIPPPDLSEGPHLAYAVQWVIFAAIAVGGLFFLAYDEAHDGALRERMRSQRAPPQPTRR